MGNVQAYDAEEDYEAKVEDVCDAKGKAEDYAEDARPVGSPVSEVLHLILSHCVRW